MIERLRKWWAERDNRRIRKNRKRLQQAQQRKT